MINLTFMQHYSPVFVLVITWFLAFLALKILKVPGPNWALVVLSALFAAIFASSTKASTYIIRLIPYFVIILVTIFLVFLVISFTGNVAIFQKPLAWAGFVIAITLIVFFAFDQFHTLGHLLPNTSDTGLTNEMKNFKNWIYSDDVKDSIVFVISTILVGFFLLKKS